MALNTSNINNMNSFAVPRDVFNAIQNASSATGVNFSYMVEKAAVESNFNTNAKAKTSSATGLYQFIERTWLDMVNKHGDKYGLSEMADKISDSGQVASKKDRAEILELRKDPQIAAYMAAEFASGNREYLQQHVGGKIGNTEMYMAHFLGAGGASGFLNAMKKNPNAAAADLFPREARANRNVFFDKQTGRARTLAEIHAHFDRKFEGTAGGATQLAERQQAPAQRTTPLRMAAAANGDERTQAPRTARAAGQIAMENDNPFLRLAAFMGTDGTRRPDSLLRINSGNATASTDSWQIFPPSLYNKLALSPAQMMMLSDFKA